MRTRCVRNFLTSALIAILVATPIAALIAPRPADAAGEPVFDVLNYVINGLTHGATAATAGSTNALVVKEYALDNIGWTVSKIAMQSVIKSTVNWINSGFQGSPAFVTDLSQNLQQVGDAAANQFISDYESNLAINSPFKDAIGQAVRANYFLSTARDGFFLQNPYTLNKVSSDDAAFLRGDFSKGGFTAWLNASLYPQNNPIGAYGLVQDALNGGVGAAQGQRKTELDWGRGFLSFRGACNSAQPASGGVDLSSADKCLSSNIETPGAMIEGQLQKVFGTSVDQLVSADELNEVVGALVGQLTNQVLGGTGLSGASQPTAGSGGSYINNATNPTQYTGATGSGNLSTAFFTTLSTEGMRVTTYRDDWQKIQTAATDAQTKIQASSCVPDGSAIIANQINPVLTQASAAIANANSILASLESIKNTLIATNASGSTAQATAISTATTAYQNLLASSQMPKSSDFTYADQQSIDTGSATPSSLYTEMAQLAAQSQCGT